MRLGRGIRHRLLTLALVGLVTAALSADALYRSISVTHAQRVERAREAVHEEIDRLGALGLSANASPSAVVGLRGGIVPRDAAAATVVADVPPTWAPTLRALLRDTSKTSPAEVTVDADRGQLIAAIAPGTGDTIRWAAVLVRPSPTLQSWRLLVVALGFSALLLVASAAYSLISVRRAVAALQGALAALGDDLSAPVPRSQIGELDDIALGVAQLARRLDESRRVQERMSRELARQERLAVLGRVVAGVAHEVRNPLASIKLRLDLAAGSDVAMPPSARAAVEHATAEIARLDRLVADLLIVAGRATGSRTSVEVGGLVRARAEALTPWAALRRVTITAAGRGRAVCDADALARAIDNVLRNGVEASPEGGTVDATIEESAGTVQVRIADHGPGVPDGRAGEIFEPFFTTKPDGTGLGLAISQAIARAHGGDLTYGREGTTTRLELTLPAAGVASAVAEVAGQSAADTA
ncbi:MAG TPA: ATP-binding protein [Polyangia bacterium]|nr:ATP-binding protein [Polyangia bacterium]